MISPEIGSLGNKKPKDMYVHVYVHEFEWVYVYVFVDVFKYIYIYIHIEKLPILGISCAFNIRQSHGDKSSSFWPSCFTRPAAQNDAKRSLSRPFPGKKHGG